MLFKTDWWYLWELGSVISTLFFFRKRYGLMICRTGPTYVPKRTKAWSKAPVGSTDPMTCELVGWKTTVAEHLLSWIILQVMTIRPQGLINSVQFQWNQRQTLNILVFAPPWYPMIHDDPCCFAIHGYTPVLYSFAISCNASLVSIIVGYCFFIDVPFHLRIKTRPFCRPFGRLIPDTCFQIICC